MNTQSFASVETAVAQNAVHEETHRGVLARVIETEIIPRLLLAHRSEGSRPRPPALQEVPPSPSEVSYFTQLLLADDMVLVRAQIERCRSNGLAVESLFLGLMTATARHLGELWGADTCGFSEVTLAMYRLQQLLHDLSTAFQCEDRTVLSNGGRVLLCPVAAEQHTFGLSILAEFFRRGGWEVIGDIPSTNEELFDSVRMQPVDLIGLSVAGKSAVGELRSIIATIRRVSRNPAIQVMVGGNAFNEMPDRVAAVGADFMAANAREALEKADWLRQSNWAEPLHHYRR